MATLLPRSFQSKGRPTPVLKNGHIEASAEQLHGDEKDRGVFCSYNDKDQPSILSAISPSLRQTDKRLHQKNKI